MKWSLSLGLSLESQSCRAWFCERKTEIRYFFWGWFFLLRGAEKNFGRLSWFGGVGPFVVGFHRFKVKISNLKLLI